MNPLARFTGIGILGLAGVGLYHIATDRPDLHLEAPSFSSPIGEPFGSPVDDEKPLVSMPPGDRMTFDGPMVLDIAPASYADVWWCDGETGVIVGPAHVENVCAAAFYRT
jgi:hypothetical protein